MHPELKTRTPNREPSPSAGKTLNVSCICICEERREKGWEKGGQTECVRCDNLTILLCEAKLRRMLRASNEAEEEEESPGELNSDDLLAENRQLKLRLLSCEEALEDREFELKQLRAQLVRLKKPSLHACPLPPLLPAENLPPVYLPADALCC